MPNRKKKKQKKPPEIYLHSKVALFFTAAKETLPHGE